MLSWTGDVFVRLRYVWERNKVDNWQQGLMSPYLNLVEFGIARAIDMARPIRTTKRIYCRLYAKKA